MESANLMDSYVGKRLDGRYEIREIIGVGGMAVVYKAYDNIDDRIVAVKILKEEFLANEEFRRRFKNESKAIAVLSHPNIVKVYDVSFGDRLQYIVMEYVEGITLKEYIEQQKVVNWKEAIHFVTQILRALQHAHDKGIVHRDIKPQNIMLLQNGNIKVTDFGIARFSRGETRTMTASAIGSVHYISPEQARGEITDDKADIYSVGVVLYEMITGELPFQSDSAVSVAIMQLQADAKKPREINNNIPIGLEQITMRAMQKNPKDRFQSSAEMLLDLDEFKRNPSIKFNYNYFVDSEPTKFIDKPVSSPTQNEAPILNEENYDEYDDEQDLEERNKAVPIVVGVVSALLVATLIIIGCLFAFTDVFKSKKVVVPNFVGKIYEEEIKGNDEYNDFKFDIAYVSSSDDKEGQVTKQSPYPDTKVKKGSKIKLEVVKSGSLKTIPDVESLDVSTAKQKLSSAGFTEIEIVKQPESSVEKGTVIRSDPAAGKKADVSETVTLYVATDEEEEMVKVPGVVGSTLKDAKDILSDAKLDYGGITYKDSDLPKDTVIEQSIPKNQSVKKGTKVNLVLSSGNKIQKSVKITFDIPDDNGTKGLYEVYLGNTQVKISTPFELNGGSATEIVKGEGTQTVSVYFTGSNGNKRTYIATVDFTTGEIKNSRNIKYPSLKPEKPDTEDPDTEDTGADIDKLKEKVGL